MSSALRRLWAIGDTPSAIALGRYATMGLSLLTVPVIARVLEPVGRGESASLLAAVGIATIVLGLGVPLACRRRAASGEPDADIVLTGRVYALATAVPALAIGAVLHLALFRESAAEVVLAFYLSMGLIPLSISWAIDVSMLIVRQRYRRMALLGVINAGCNFAVIVAGWLAGVLSVALVVYALLAANVVTFLAGASWVRSRGGRVRGLWQTVREGLSLAGGQLAEVAGRRLDQIIVFAVLGASSAGIYSVATTISQLPQPVAQSLGVIAFTSVDPRGASARQQTTAIVRQSIALALLATAVVAVLTPLAIPLLFGEPFLQAVPIALVLLVSAFGGAVAYNGAMVLAALQRGREMTVVQFAGAAVGVVAALVLALLFGTLGAAAGVGIGSTATAALILWRLGVTPRGAVPAGSDFAAAFRVLLRRSE